MKNIRPRITNISTHLLQHSDVVVRVQQDVFLCAVRRHLVRFQTCLCEHHDQALRRLVLAGDRDRLFCGKTGQLREGLRPWPLLGGGRWRGSHPVFVKDERDMEDELVRIVCAALSYLFVWIAGKVEER